MLLPLAFVAGLVVGVAAGSTEADDGDVATAAVDASQSTRPHDEEAPPTITTAQPALATTTSAPSHERGSQGAPLAIGESVMVGDYDVAVVGITPDATAQVLDANQFNDRPADGEVYALVRVRATFTVTVKASPGWTCRWATSATTVGSTWTTTAWRSSQTV